MPPEYYSSPYCFLELAQRRMGLICSRQYVCMDLVLIDIQNCGTRQENNGSSNLCLVLHKDCLLVQLVFMIRIGNSLHLTVKSCFAAVYWIESKFLNSTSCLQSVELGPVERVRFYFLEAVPNQVPVEDTMLLILLHCQWHLMPRSLSWTF